MQPREDLIPKLGTTFLNRYRIDSRLGQGGMGIVCRAHYMLLERDVAIKFLSRSGLGSEGRAHLLVEPWLHRYPYSPLQFPIFKDVILNAPEGAD